MFPVGITENILSAEAPIIFGLFTALISLVSSLRSEWRARVLSEAKDRAIACFVHGASLYIFICLLFLSLTDMDLLLETLQNVFGKTEVAVALTAGALEAFNGLFRSISKQD